MTLEDFSDSDYLMYKFRGKTPQSGCETKKNHF